MFDIAGARSQSYSDDDIVSHLAQSGRVPFDFAKAKEAGYSSKEILEAIDARQQSQRQQQQAAGGTEPGKASGILPALAQGGADVLSGAGETLKQYTPFGGAGDALKNAGAKIAPNNYDRAHVVDDKGFHAGNIPQVAAESAPGAAAGIAAARLAGKRFGLPGAILGGMASYYLTNVGNRAKERAAYDTGDENAQPTLGQKAAAAVATVPEAAVGGAAATRFLPGAGRMINVGSRGVAEAGGRLATTAALEGAAGGAQNAIAQTGRTIGTEPGFKFDPTEATNAAATGAALAPVFGGAKAARDVNTSIKYRDIDPTVARRVANDIATSAEGGADALSSPKTGFHAVNDTAKNYATDLQTSVNALKREMGTRPLPGEAEGVVRRAANGRAITERDINILENTAAGTQSGPSVVEMARKINTLARLKKTGTFKDESFVGGAGHAMERALPVLGQPVKGAAYAGLALTGASHAGLLIPSAGALGGLLGTYGAARLLDRAMGTRSPAKSFVDRFAGPVPPGSSPQLPGAFNPTGPRVGQQRPLASPWGSPVAPPVPPGATPNLPALAPQHNGPPGVINQPPPAPQPMLGGPGGGPSSPFPPPPGRGPIPQPGPNMPLLGHGGPIMQQPPAPQRMLPAPTRAQLPDVANRSAYEPEVRALLTAANAKAKTQRSAEAWMQRMLGDSGGEVNVDEPTPAPVAKKAKRAEAAPVAERINYASAGATRTPENKQAALAASALKKAKAPKAAPSSETAAPTAAVSAAPPPPARPHTETTPNSTNGSIVKDTESPVVQPQKTRLASPLAARMAAQHNTEVTRKPVETKPQVKRDKPLSMSEQLNEDVVHEAIKGGAKTAKEVVSKGEDPEDRQSLRATLNRMIAEGSVSFSEKKASPVPAAVRAQVKAQAKPVEVAKPTPAPAPAKAVEAPKSTVVPFKQPSVPARDQWDSVIDAVRAKSKLPTKAVDDLDAERRSRMSSNKDAAQRGREVLAKVQPAQAAAKRAVEEDPWAIPDFAKRTKEAPKAAEAPKAVATTRPDIERLKYDAYEWGYRAKENPENVTYQRNLKDATAALTAAGVNESAVPRPAHTKTSKPALTEATRAADKASEAEGPPKSPHYKKGDLDATIKSAQHDYENSPRGKSMPPQNLAGGLRTIDRIIREKATTGEKIAKEIPGFDAHDFTDRFIHSRSHAGGEQLRDFMKTKYPGHDDVFDSHMHAGSFSTIYANKTSAADGTAKKRK